MRQMQVPSEDVTASAEPFHLLTFGRIAFRKYGMSTCPRPSLAISPG
jgi:hypothetical protein